MDFLLSLSLITSPYHLSGSLNLPPKNNPRRCSTSHEFVAGETRNSIRDKDDLWALHPSGPFRPSDAPPACDRINVCVILQFVVHCKPIGSVNPASPRETRSLLRRNTFLSKLSHDPILRRIFSPPRPKRHMVRRSVV